MSGKYAFDDPDQDTAFDTAEDESEKIAQTQAQYDQARKGFDETRAFRQYIQAISEPEEKRKGSQTRYSPSTIT